MPYLFPLCISAEMPKCAQTPCRVKQVLPCTKDHPHLVRCHLLKLRSSSTLGAFHPLQGTSEAWSSHQAQVVSDSRMQEIPPSALLAGEMIAFEPIPPPPSAQYGQQRTDCKYPTDVLEHMGSYRLSAQSGVPMSNYLRPSSPTTLEFEEIIELEDLIIDFSCVDRLNNFIQQGSGQNALPFTSDMSWDEHRRGFELLHLLRPTIQHLREECPAMKEKIKKLKKDLKKKETELENLRIGRVQKKTGYIRNGKKRKRSL